MRRMRGDAAARGGFSAGRASSGSAQTSSAKESAMGSAGLSARLSVKLSDRSSAGPISSQSPWSLPSPAAGSAAASSRVSGCSAGPPTGAGAPAGPRWGCARPGPWQCPGTGGPSLSRPALRISLAKSLNRPACRVIWRAAGLQLPGGGRVIPQPLQNPAQHPAGLQQVRIHHKAAFQNLGRLLVPLAFHIRLGQAQKLARPPGYPPPRIPAKAVPWS